MCFAEDVVRGELRSWVLSDEGDKWAVQLYVRDWTSCYY